MNNKNINWLAIIGSALLCLFVLVFLMKLQVNNLTVINNYRRGKLEAQSEAFRYIKYRIGDKYAVGYIDFLEEKAQKAKPRENTNVKI